MIDLRAITGEVLRRSFVVSSDEPGDVIVITSAVWTLFDAKTREEVDAGSCEIDGCRLFVLLPLLQSGEYILRCTAEIPPETVKCDVRILVSDRVEK